jgi:DNA-binding MarR family transcriptional regulator
MKRFIIPALIILILTPLASLSYVQELNATIDIRGNDQVNMELDLTFPHTSEQVYFSIPYPINDLEVEGGVCYVERDIKNVLICEPPSPFFVGQVMVDASFKTEGMIEREENTTFFNLDIPILQDTDRANIFVKLPELMALVDNELLPLSPSGADIGSDGRRITLRWNFRDQFKGDIIPLRIYYESINPTNFIQLINVRWIIFFLIIIVVGIYLVYDKVSKRSGVVLSVLNEPERIVVKILQEKGGEDVNQKKIVKATGFSKAKVSRILQSLEARGVISKERVGRRNKITVKKKFVEEEA